MGVYSTLHWAIVLVVLVVIGFPIARILQRTGHSPWWVLLGLIPLVNWIALWVFAYSRWPAVPEPTGDEDRRLNL